MVVSQLRDKVQRLAWYLQVHLQAENGIYEEAQFYKKEAAVAQQKIAELKEKNSRDGVWRTRRARPMSLSLC